MYCEQLGISWDWGENFFYAPSQPPVPGQPAIGIQSLPSPGAIILTYAVQVVLWLLFAYWFDQVWQGEHGAARPWDFCLKRQRRRADIESGGARQDQALAMVGLTKTFGDHTAVDGLTLQVRPSRTLEREGSHRGQLVVPTSSNLGAWKGWEVDS